MATARNLRLLRYEGLVCALFVALLLGPAVTGQSSVSSASPALGETLYATPYAMAFDTMERIRDGADSVPERPGGTQRLTRDQMLVVLAHVELAQRLPALAASSLESAGKVWDAAQVANSGDGYYHVTLLSESICIQLETNAWALQAAMAYGKASGDADAVQQATDLARTLTAALTRQSVDGVPLCPANLTTPPSEWPLVLWTLLVYAERNADASTARSVVSRLRTEADLHVRDGFVDPSVIRLAEQTAQFLLAFGAATAAGHPFAAQRNAMVTALESLFVREEGGHLVTYNLLDESGSERSEARAEATMWTAHALDTYANESTIPRRLLDGLVRRHYSADLGGYARGTELVGTGPHALTAVLTTGALAATPQAQAARVVVVIPPEPTVRFGEPGEAGADRSLVSNEWSLRFTLAGARAGERILLPLGSVGPVNLGFPESRYTPKPTLRINGEPAAATFQLGAFPLVEFSAHADASATYLLQAYAPVFPDVARVGRDFHVFFRVNGTGPVTVGSLQLELPVRAVTVSGVSIDSRPMPPEGFLAQDVGPTEFVATDHVRVQVRDLVLTPAARTEIVISYEDALSPNVTDVRFAHDASQQRPLDEKADKLRTGPGGEAHVEARVTDNAVVRRVLLVVGQGLNTTEVAMAPEPNDPTLFRGVLRGLPLDEPTTVRVRAVDEHGNLRESAEYQVQAQSGFLAEGSLIILVFSAVLMGMAAAIYIKMGRKKDGR